MSKLKMLVLTDHRNHSKENSLYALVQSARQHPHCAQVDIATRANAANDPFFKQQQATKVWATKAGEDFSFYQDGRIFQYQLREVSLAAYDAVWLRLPPPLSQTFLSFLEREYPQVLFINSPKGIYEMGSKAFLTNFAEYCAPMKICRTIEEIIDFKNQFPIVLKPFREYGGKGIVRIADEQVWEGTNKISFATFAEKIRDTDVEYLGVKFLERVSEGDKRIVVVDGKIIGASLRLPASDSWLCNVAIGGTSNPTEIAEEEKAIIQSINPILSELGILMYGVDTLMGDEGKRVLSEINTTSIGGVPQIAHLSGKPLVREVTDLIWNHIIKKLQ